MSISLRYDVTRSKFTTKPRLREFFFSNLCHLPVIFARELFSTSVPREFVHAICILNAICILKTRLGGEISLSDVIVHRGYCLGVHNTARSGVVIIADFHLSLA